MRRVIVNRGPQLVQFKNGYRHLRSTGSSNSRRQSGQVAASAGIPVLTRPNTSLATIRNPASPVRWQLPQCHPVDPRQRRSLRAQPLQKGLHSRCLPLNLYRHSVRIVPDKPRKPLFHRQPVNKRAESHSLHHPANQHPPPQGRRFMWSLLRMEITSQENAPYRRQA